VINSPRIFVLFSFCFDPVLICPACLIVCLFSVFFYTMPQAKISQCVKFSIKLINWCFFIFFLFFYSVVSFFCTVLDVDLYHLEINKKYCRRLPAKMYSLYCIHKTEVLEQNPFNFFKKFFRRIYVLQKILQKAN